MTHTVLSLPEVASQLKRDRFSVVEAQFSRPDTALLDTPVDGFDGYRLLIDDYTQGRTLEVTGRVSHPDEVMVREVERHS
jgi:hypothetical protein